VQIEEREKEEGKNPAVKACKHTCVYCGGDWSTIFFFSSFCSLMKLRVFPRKLFETIINPLTPNDHYSGCTAPLTSKRCILYIYSTNKGNEYLKHGIYCPFFSLQNAVCFINLTYLVSVLFTFYIQNVLTFKK